MAEAQVAGYQSRTWGTYRQWAASGGQVRRGAEACHVVFYREIEIASADRSGDEPETRLFARATPVFNADQVDGLPSALPAASVPMLTEVETFVTAARAVVRHGGNVACYEKPAGTGSQFKKWLPARPEGRRLQNRCRPHH